MTRKETEVFLKDCPRLFSNFLSNKKFCLPYGSGWFDILHKCCLKLEMLNKDGIYVVFEKAEYTISEIDKKHSKSGIIKFCVNIIKPECLYSSYHERLGINASKIISRLINSSAVICERCGAESTKVNNIVEKKKFRCVCDLCFKKINGTNNEQCNNKI